MKYVNGLPVYEKDDPCALHEYSEEMAKKIQEKENTQKEQIENLNKQYTQLNQGLQSANMKIEILDDLKAGKVETEEQFRKIYTDQERQDKEINGLKDSAINITTDKQKSLHIEDSSNLPAKINIFGNSEQESDPSLETPSNIKNVGSNINFLKADLFSTRNINGIDFVNNGDGTYTLNGTATENAFYAKDITLNPGTYTLSGCPKDGQQDKYGLQILGQGAGDFGSGQTFTIKSQTTVTVRMMVWKGVTVSNLIFKPKLEEGDTATSYSPYNCGNIGVNKTNSNILPQFEETKESQTINGITITKNSDGTYTLNGTSTGIVDLILFGSWTSEGVKLRLNKGILYFKTNSTKINGSINCFSKSISKSFSINVNSYFNNQVVEDVSYVFIRLCTGAGVTFNNENVVLELSYDDVDNLEVNKNEKIVFPLEEGQRLMLGDYLGEDEKIHHVRKQIVLDGAENITAVYEFEKTARFTFANFNTSTNNRDELCTHFKLVYQYLEDSEHFYIDENGNLYIFIDKSIANTIEGMKTWLANQKTAGTPVIIEFNLAEEETENFTEDQKTAFEQLQNCDMYKPITNIITEDNMALIEANYIADTKTYIDNKTANMQKQLNIINELLSTTSTSAKLLDNLKSDLEREVL